MTVLGTINWKQKQQRVKAMLQRFGAIPCTISFLDATSTTSIVSFDRATLENIDNRQNPTPIMGQSVQLGYVPGDVQWPTDPGGEIKYKIGNVTWIKRIAKVNAIQPATVPIMYALELE